MNHWTFETLQSAFLNFIPLAPQQKDFLISYMNRHFPPFVVSEQLQKRKNALNNMKYARTVLNDAEQLFPNFTNFSQIVPSLDDIKGCAIVLTAGGEGERLRLSLLEKGVSPEALRDFTKATYPIDNFFMDFGALHINLALIAYLCNEAQTDIPVIITTGAQGSTTARVIPELLKKHHNFGLNHVLVVQQDERIHFTTDEKAVLTFSSELPYPVTQPDETGGPLMKLKLPVPNYNSALDWLKERNCQKLIIIQGTAVYTTKLIPIMASAATRCDCLSVGILRKDFPEKDPYGTIVTVKKNDHLTTMIVEQDIRNNQTRMLKDKTDAFYLPYNTGFYAIDIDLLYKNDLPDYATPPKEILPDLPRSPKIGYAATDLLTLAKNPLTLTIDQDMFAVIKNADDIAKIGTVAKRFGLDILCKESALRN